MVYILAPPRAAKTISPTAPRQITGSHSMASGEVAELRACNIEYLRHLSPSPTLSLSDNERASDMKAL